MTIVTVTAMAITAVTAMTVTTEMVYNDNNISDSDNSEVSSDCDRSEQ